MPTVAITRSVAPAIVDCELSHLGREPIDFETAHRQHQDYCAALAALGLEVVTLEHGGFADGVFVEDPIVVADELAIVTRMGVSSREAESSSLAAVVGRYRPLVALTAPATLEGGDVLRIGKTFYIGLSGRTNAEGAEQFRLAVEPHGYRVAVTRVEGCLHFKSACGYLGGDQVLVNSRYLSPEVFNGLDIIAVDPAEDFAANALEINGTVLYSSAYPRTLERLLARGLRVQTVDNSELLKAESALTCMSLLL